MNLLLLPEEAKRWDSRNLLQITMPFIVSDGAGVKGRAKMSSLAGEKRQTTADGWATAASFEGPTNGGKKDSVVRAFFGKGA